MLIPRVLHRIWLGAAEMPPAFEGFWGSWHAHHPGWDFQTWTDANLPQLENEEAFNHTQDLGLRSDVLRYEILLKHGGVYVDTDMEAMRSIEPLIQFLTCFSAREFRGHDQRRKICPAIIGATPQHMAIRALVDAIPRRVLKLPTDRRPDHNEVVDATGPSLVADVWKDCEQTTVFEAGLFFPFHWDEKSKANETFPNAFTKHYWGNSWHRT